MSTDSVRDLHVRLHHLATWHTPCMIGHAGTSASIV